MNSSHFHAVLAVMYFGSSVLFSLAALGVVSVPWGFLVVAAVLCVLRADYHYTRGAQGDGKVITYE